MTWQFVYKKNIHKVLWTRDKIKENLTTGCEVCVIYLFTYLFIYLLTCSTFNHSVSIWVCRADWDLYELQPWSWYSM